MTTALSDLTPYKRIPGSATSARSPNHYTGRGRRPSLDRMEIERQFEYDDEQEWEPEDEDLEDPERDELDAHAPVRDPH
jgi:Chromatin assembly factor 1 subunit A